MARFESVEQSLYDNLFQDLAIISRTEDNKSR